MKNYFIYLPILIITFGFTQEQIGQGLHGTSLITYLQNNYTTNSVLSYNNARDILYSEIDQQSNGSVYCIYTNYSVSLPGNVDPSTHLYENGMNCEHVWPQSMYEGSSPMKSDMHHLRPSKENANSYRGNKPFNESNDNQTNNWLWLTYNQSNTPSSNIDEYSENHSNIFEPREDVKGDIARTMFYFYTIYTNEADASFFQSQKDILLTWHNNDSVTNEEINRTWMIAGYQNNIPNPFILDESLIYRAYFYDEPIMGDLNTDGIVNVIDIILIVNYVIENENFSNDEINIADINLDGIVNVIDIIIFITLILGE